MPDVTHADDEPIGTILGPDGATLALVYPPRLPFGFTPLGGTRPMRTVTLLVDRGGHSKGTDVELDDGSAQFLIDVGDAVAAGEDAPEVLGTRTQDEVIHPVLEAGPGDADVEPLDLPTSSGEPVKDVDSDQRDPVVPDALPMADDPNVADPRQGHVEGVGGEYDPTKHTVADVNAKLDELREQGDEDEVARILQAESEGRGRSGILDA